MAATAIIGAKGHVGAALADLGAGYDAADPYDLTGVECVINCAVVWNDPRASLALNLDLIAAAESAGVRRFIFCSSVQADPESVAFYEKPFDEYGAVKLATEAFLRAYHLRTGAAVFCLRLGAFDHPTAHRPWALTPKGLRYAVAKAMVMDGFHIWTVMGDGE